MMCDLLKNYFIKLYMSNQGSFFKRIYDRYQVWINLVIIPIVGVVVFWLLIQFMDFWTHHGETAKMPNVEKKNYYDALNILESQGFEVEVDSIFDLKIKHGQVVDQSPKPNEIVKYGRTVYLKINSFFPEMKKVDDKLLHISSVQAQKTLQSMGFTRIVVKYIDGANEDEVIRIRYNGKEYRRGEKVPVTAEVEITVTKAKEETYSVDEARRQVEAREKLENDSLSNVSDDSPSNSEFEEPQSTEEPQSITSTENPVNSDIEE